MIYSQQPILMCYGSQQTERITVLKYLGTHIIEILDPNTKIKGQIEQVHATFSKKNCSSVMTIYI